MDVHEATGGPGPGSASTPPVAGVFFDLGGTLVGYRSRHRLREPFDDALRRLGIDPEAPATVDARRDAAAGVEHRYARLRSFLHLDLFRDRLVATARTLGAEPSADELARYDHEQVAAFVEHLVPVDDAHATLAALGERGVHRAVVSNADDSWLVPLLRRHGLDAHLEGWTSSEAAGSCKPDRGIFEVALERAGLHAAEVLFVGDSLPHDVAGAHALGFRTVLVAGGTSAPLGADLPATVEPDHRIDRLAEVLDLVDAAR